MSPGLPACSCTCAENEILLISLIKEQVAFHNSMKKG